MGRWKGFAALLVFGCMADGAQAGAIYACKGAHGVTSYQNMPCAKAADELGHGAYSDALARPPTPPPPQYVPPPVASAPASSPATGAAYVPAPPAASAGFRCTAGPRTWIQLIPCPATYTKTTDIDAEGYTDSGEHVNGTADFTQQLPVQQDALDRSTLCDQVRAGARIGQGGGDDAAQSYARNKMKRNLCGG